MKKKWEALLLVGVLGVSQVLFAGWGFKSKKEEPKPAAAESEKTAVKAQTALVSKDNKGPAPSEKAAVLPAADVKTETLSSAAPEKKETPRPLPPAPTVEGHLQAVVKSDGRDPKKEAEQLEMAATILKQKAHSVTGDEKQSILDSAAELEYIAGHLRAGTMDKVLMEQAMEKAKAADKAFSGTKKPGRDL